MTGPARRFLHVCYCCKDAEPVTEFFVDALALRNTMSTPVEPSDGALLGMDGQIVSSAAFVYDARGPRTSPAIEVQGWIDPPLLGTPVQDPGAVGIGALGFSVPELASANERLQGLGCTVIASGRSPFGTTWATVQDPTGVIIDVIEDSTVPDGETRMRHLRITVTDLEVSLPWYEGIGFEVVDKAHIDDASFLGRSGAADADVVRLRLPDEPYEAMLIQWNEPRSHGRHVSEPNHAGIYRTALGVDDTRAAHAALVDAGVEFDRAPISVELKGTPVPDMWICFLSDPDGVPFELVGRPRSAFR
jgi:catechol 2,3-dioxygenase-like lactoylglutathione lyase family enzyme